VLSYDACMFVVNIFRSPSWIGFKKLCGQNHAFRALSFRDEFANGWIGVPLMVGCGR
jgi:hypothetical protein